MSSHSIWLSFSTFSSPSSFPRKEFASDSHISLSSRARRSFSLCSSRSSSGVRFRGIALSPQSATMGKAAAAKSLGARASTVAAGTDMVHSAPRELR